MRLEGAQPNSRSATNRAAHGGPRFLAILPRTRDHALAIFAHVPRPRLKSEGQYASNGARRAAGSDKQGSGVWQAGQTHIRKDPLPWGAIMNMKQEDRVVKNTLRASAWAKLVAVVINLDASVVLADLLHAAIERAEVELDSLVQRRLVVELAELLELAGVELVRGG